MTAILCHQCKRPNGISARNCIWCNAQLAPGGAPQDFDATAVEANYLEGIDRLDDPGPVRLIISHEGIQVVEMVPGSRTVAIPAASIVDAGAERSEAGRQPGASPWWRNALNGLRAGSARTNTPIDENGYILTVKYTVDGETRTALFSCSERGKAVARRLERLRKETSLDANHADEPQ